MNRAQRDKTGGPARRKMLRYPNNQPDKQQTNLEATK